LADAGYSVSRVQLHFADVRDPILTGRFGASSSESRSSKVGQKLSFVNVGLRVASTRLHARISLNPQLPLHNARKERGFQGQGRVLKIVRGAVYLSTTLGNAVPDVDVAACNLLQQEREILRSHDQRRLATLAAPTSSVQICAANSA